MYNFPILVKIFFKQLIRSKALWIISGLLLVMVLLIFFYESNMQEWLGSGMTYDMATGKASNQLKNLSNSIVSYSILFIIIISALIAPGSRKNGTTQFVLCMQVSRLKLALAQFSALSIFVCIATLIIHIGFAITAIKVSLIGFPELFLAWIPFLATLLVASAISFSLSTGFSTIATYIILFGIPKILLPLIQELMVWKGQWIPVPVARLFDNLAMLFPDPKNIIFWPFLSPQMDIISPPYPLWTWCLLNYSFGALFWILVGFYCYSGNNIGSRQVLK